MLLARILEFAPVAVILGQRAENTMAGLAKKLYSPWTHEEFRGPMDDFLRSGFQLGQKTVSPLEGWIEGQDGPEHVQPKVMDVLLCLARRRGEVVERDTIVDEVWDGRAVGDDVLTRCISELRHVLGDQAEKPAYIQTIPKRGYRLLADVEAVAQEPTETTETSTTEIGGDFLDRHFRDLKQRKVFQTMIGYPVIAWVLVQIVDVIWAYLLAPMGAPPWLVPSFVVLLALGYPIAVFLSWALDITPEGMRLTKRREGTNSYLGLTVVGVATAVVTVGALFTYFSAYDATAPSRLSAPEIEVASTPAQNSIAVLRFLNISGNPAIGYIGDGLTEELIHELTNLQSFKVAARTSVWPFSTTDLHVTEIARRLSVDRVLEGSIRADGDQVRVTAQLIDEAGFHIWSETYDRALGNILEIQKDIASKVVSELNIVLTDNTKTRLAQQPTINSGAYDQYLQGRQFLRQPSNAESLASAQALFEAAIALDNRFPLAFAGLCETHLANYRLTGATEHFERAELACHRALYLDDGLAEVFTALGNLYRHFGQNDKALDEYQRALAINPMLEEANFGLGRVYQAQGRLAEAEDVLRRGIEIEPSYWGSHLGLGNFLLRQGRFAESLPYYRTVTELAPDYAGGFINLGSALHWLGQWTEAETAWLRALELEADAIAYQNMGTLYYYQQRYYEAAAMHQQAIQLAPSDHSNWGKLAAAQRYGSGQELESRSSYVKAIELVRQQLAINPDEPEDLYHLSVYLVNTDELDDARAAIQRSLNTAPESPSAHYFAAILEMRSGDNEKALSELANAVQLGYSLELLAVDPEFEELRNFNGFPVLGENNQ